MDMSEVKAFNAELSGLYDNKPPISKAKMSAITRGAIKAIKFYKHVVHSVEKFIQKCKPEYKVPGLYVIDSIVRQSRHQFGQDKDVFAARFAKNMQQTFANLFRCPPEQKGNIIRVLNLWQKNNVFSSEVIQPLLNMADPNHPLHQEIQQQQNNSNGSTLNISHTSDKMSPGQQQHTPHISSPMGDQFQDQSSQPSSVKFNRKLLNDFEYDSEDDTARHDSNMSQQQQHPPPTNHNPADALGSILTNPEIMRQLQSLQAQMQLMSGMSLPNVMPMVPDMQMVQQQNQTLPFMTQPPQDHNQKHDSNNKDETANESDIEFVETGPQVIEIPDANDSRWSGSGSPRRRSRSPRRRRRSRDRRRDRDRDRDRDKDKDRDKSYKEREVEKEKQREREKKGLPPIKKEHLSVCSTTLWVGHLSKLATQEELSDLFGGIGGVVSIDVVGPRGCAFVVMERRRDAAKAKEKLDKHKLHSKEITVAWAPGKGVKGRDWKDYWESELGASYLPWARLQAAWRLGALSLDALEDGGAVDEDTLPDWLPPRIMPKSLLEPPLSLLPGLPPGAAPGMMPGMPGMPPGAGGPGGMPMPGPPGGLQMQMNVPRMGLPGLGGSLPMGALPPGMRPPAPVPGALLGFPPGMPPPQSLGQPGMVGGFLGGLLGLGGLMPPVHLPPHAHPPAAGNAAPSNPSEVTRTDDAMELDNDDQPDTRHDNVLSEQLQALLSKPPPNFNASEPPPNFNSSEPPPPFNSKEPPPNFNLPPPNEDKDKKDEDKDRDRRDDKDRDRRDRDRRDRDRGRDRRDRDRDRDRNNRDRDREERKGDRDRDRDRGRDRGNRDRDRDRERNRDGSSKPRERSRDRSPRNLPTANTEQSSEKTLQERLWEMANGKPANQQRDHDKADQSQQRDGFNDQSSQRMDEDNGDVTEERHNPMDRHEHPSALLEVPESMPEGGWTQLPPPRPNMAPAFRAELRMRGPPRASIRGWMEGPNFGPRFNGMGPMPFNRPPFERPPFDGPMFDGPPRFERPPFNRMPFDGPRPPFDGSRPPFDGPRPPFDGPRPPFDGPMPFDGPFDNERQFEGPPRFDGPPEFFDRNNRRFDDREQYNDRWNGDNRDREWDRRNEWDDRRRDRRSRDHDDRFTRDRRRPFDDRRPRDDGRAHGSEPTDDTIYDKDDKKDDKPPRREKDRKSRWGVAEAKPADDMQQDANDEAEGTDAGETGDGVPNKDFEPNQEASERVQKIIERIQREENLNANKEVASGEQEPAKEPLYKEESKEGASVTTENTETNTEDSNKGYDEKEAVPAMTEPEMPPPIEPPTMSLYDDNEIVDKTFATQEDSEVPEKTEPMISEPFVNEPIVDKEPVVEEVESSKSSDMFSDNKPPATDGDSEDKVETEAD